jgi:transcriptional regulator with XRE-family HTH domain
MPETLCFDDLSLGNLARIQRVCLRLTQQEIASKAGVSQNDVYSFEGNQRLPLTTKLKLLRAYDLIVETSNAPVHA